MKKEQIQYCILYKYAFVLENVSFSLFVLMI